MRCSKCGRTCALDTKNRTLTHIFVYDLAFTTEREEWVTDSDECNLCADCTKKLIRWLMEGRKW